MPDFPIQLHMRDSQFTTCHIQILNVRMSGFMQMFYFKLDRFKMSNLYLDHHYWQKYIIPKVEYKPLLCLSHTQLQLFPF